MLVNEVRCGYERAVVKAWGPASDAECGVTSWSLPFAQHETDGTPRAALVKVLGELSARNVYAPHVGSASARIVSPTALSQIVHIRDGVNLRRNSRFPADGTLIRPGDAFAMCVAGCPVVIATGGGHMVVAHAGRDSLVDRGAVTGTSTRTYVSVVHAILATFREEGVQPGRIAMRMLLAIPAEKFGHWFGHPQYGGFNRRLAEFVDFRWKGACSVRSNGSGPCTAFLNLERLFIAQAIEAGVQEVETSHPLSDHPCLAHTHDGHSNRGRRNLVVVKRLT